MTKFYEKSSFFLLLKVRQIEDVEVLKFRAIITLSNIIKQWVPMYLSVVFAPAQEKTYWQGCEILAGLSQNNPLYKCL